MILSRLLMVFALAILAYLVYITMSDCDTFKNKLMSKVGKQENFVQIEQVKSEPITPNAPINNIQEQIIYNAPVEHMTNQQVVQHIEVPVEHFQQPEYVAQQIAQHEVPNINYEHFEANVDGVADSVNGAAPFGGKSELDEGKFATVKYTGLVDAKPGDVIQIEGTDLLTAPLVDNMLYTNSIANTNRNASNDLRGDIPLQFNDTYTPFYSSVIYGAPLSQKQMTIGNL
jgi:hypothetical protein